MIVDPVQSAISAFKDVDGVFRQDRLDKERVDQQKFQNNLATGQDQRAAESHGLVMQQDARQRQQEGIQSLRYKLSTDPTSLTEDDFQVMSKDPKLSKYLTQPDLIVRDIGITADLHNDVPKLIGVPKLISEAPDDASKQALVTDAADAKKRIMTGLTLLGKDRLVANPENTDGEVQNLLMTPNGLVIEGRFTKKDGKEVVAPLTEGKSSGPDDPVNFYNIKDIMTNITSNAKMLSGLKTALEARGVELGDKTLIDKAEATSKGHAAAKVLEDELPNMTPAQQLQANTAIGFLKSGEAKSVEEALRLSALVKPGKQGMALPEGSIYIDPSTGKTIAENPKSAGKGDRFKTEEGVKGRPGWVQDVYTDGDGKEVKRGEPRLQFNPRPDNSGKSNKELERESRADIDKSAAELAKRRVSVNRNSAAANASGDPDAIREATRDADAYNAESAALTAKFEAHKREFGRNYTPTSAPPSRSAGMESPPVAPTAKAKAAAPSNKATSDGKNVTFQGKSYPLNADGTVTISGKKYKVQ